MRFPTKYTSIITNRRSVLIIATNLLLSVCLTVLFVLSLIYDVLFIWYLSLCIFISTLLIFTNIIYFRTYKSVKSRIQQARLGNRPQRQPSQELAKAVMLILLSAWVCYTPMAISSVFKSYKHYIKSHIVSVIFFSSEILIYTNSTLNAVIFIMFNISLKNYALQRLQILCPRIRRSGTQAAELREM